MSKRYLGSPVGLRKMGPAVMRAGATMMAVATTSGVTLKERLDEELRKIVSDATMEAEKAFREGGSREYEGRVTDLALAQRFCQRIRTVVEQDD